MHIPIRSFRSGCFQTSRSSSHFPSSKNDPKALSTGNLKTKTIKAYLGNKLKP